MQKLKEISLPIIMVLVLLAAGVFITVRYYFLEGQISQTQATLSQVVSFLNQQIAASQKQVAPTK